ncbi:phosphonates import ATP-binding protein PhnC [Caldalkalibacillus thermarum]|uniref:phosphonate ABC transporter ATP-binding protein n=1 Tax=Caldalkalibacillus thermarum TaxID=296745 RepID=UPI00166358D8|nr:phosphonate ABC transporter ATP-binding protein [Caldalkalibacillus thermarum]GGK11858.1 phosphonates import ATP-binding protein PhnC [Caldalkalibacillus thermarum]
MALVIEGLTVIYNTKGKQEPALQDIDLTIQTGEFVGILGRSGAGKSTLIRSINQLVKPVAGRVNWNGTDMTKLSGQALRQARREMGMIFQHFYLIPRLTALQNCVLGRFGYRPWWKNLLGIVTAREKEEALAALDRVGIGHLAHKRVDQLSGGQQQRVAIARVIMQKPKLLLGDEPVASLDPVTSNQVLDLIKEIHHSEQMTTILNLHDVELALKYCDRIIGLAHGRKVFDGSPRQVNDKVLEQIYQK